MIGTGIFATTALPAATVGGTGPFARTLGQPVTYAGGLQTYAAPQMAYAAPQMAHTAAQMIYAAAAPQVTYAAAAPAVLEASTLAAPTTVLGGSVVETLAAPASFAPQAVTYAAAPQQVLAPNTSQYLAPMSYDEYCAKYGAATYFPTCSSMVAYPAQATSALIFTGGGSAYAAADEIFKKYDKDGSGQLETGEIQKFFSDAFPGADADLCQAMTDVVDLDHDGTLGMNEVRAFLRCYNPSSQKMKVKTALVIIDVQNDFITGSLANPYNAVDILPLINGMRDKFDVVVISMDWHPQEHCSFVESCNAGKVPIVEEVKEFAAFSSVTLKGDKDRAEHKQTLYPRHAVQGSHGGANHPELVVRSTDDIIHKGTRANIDSYSAFFDNCKANDTGLTAVLEAKGVTDVYCCGLVFDICVKSTALHGAEMGFKMSVIEEACRPLSKDNVEATKSELAEAGVSIVSAAKAVEEAEAARKNMECSLEQHLTQVRKGKRAKSVHDRIEGTLCSHQKMVVKAPKKKGCC